MLKLNSLRTQIIIRGEKQPLVCPVCDLVLRDDVDVKSVKEEKACSECTINFKHINFDRWMTGWRPSTEEARAKMHI
jgi:hypothetical protein